MLSFKHICLVRDLEGNLYPKPGEKERQTHSTKENYTGNIFLL